MFSDAFMIKLENIDSIINLSWTFQKSWITNIAKKKTNRTKLVCYIVSIIIVVISDRLKIVDRISSNFTNENFFWKTKTRLKTRCTRNDSKKDFALLLDYRFSKYVNDIVFFDVQTQQQIVVVIVVATNEINKKKSKIKDKTNAFVFETKKSTIFQMFQQLIEKTFDKIEFDNKIMILQNKHICKFRNCKNSSKTKYCYIDFDIQRHMSVIEMKFKTWQRVIDENSNDVNINKSSKSMLFQWKKRNDKMKHTENKKFKTIVKKKKFSVFVSSAIEMTSIMMIHFLKQQQRKNARVLHNERVKNRRKFKKKHFNRRISIDLLNTNDENESNEMFFSFKKIFVSKISNSMRSNSMRNEISLNEYVDWMTIRESSKQQNYVDDFDFLKHTFDMNFDEFHAYSKIQSAFARTKTWMNVDMSKFFIEVQLNRKVKIFEKWRREQQSQKFSRQFVNRQFVSKSFESSIDENETQNVKKNKNIDENFYFIQNNLIQNRVKNDLKN